jgi:V/A-type H+/Na+-transporting ATPase subunit E
MKGLETGKDKLKKICDVLRRETLEPAEREKEEIVTAARGQADEIVAEAKILAKKMVDEAHLEIEKQKEVFHAALSHASRQAVDALKEKIEQNLFDPALANIVTKPLQEPELIAKVITAIVHALEKEGTKSDLSAEIAGAVSARAVNECLAREVLEKLKEKSVVVGTLSGGVEIKLLKDHITLAVTDEVVQEMLAAYIRKDFRDFVFKR